MTARRRRTSSAAIRTTCRSRSTSTSGRSSANRARSSLDTGFDAAMGEKRQRELIKPVGEGLQAIGIDPATVETVIVSHMHYDHVGNYDLFPRARYHLQDCEMAYCHRPLHVPRRRCAFRSRRTTWSAMVRKVFDGRVDLPRRRGRDRAGRHRPPHRRPFEGAAERAGEDAARLRRARGRRRASLRASRRAAASSRSPTMWRRWSRATRRSRSSRPRATTWCRATIRWCSRAIPRPSRGSKAGWRGSMPSRRREHYAATEAP